MSKDTKKKTDKQIFRRWVAIMVLAFVGGALGGFFSVPALEMIEKITSGMEINTELLWNLSLGIFLAVNVIGIFITYYFYRKAKNMTECWDGENEEELDVIEDKLDYALLPISIVTSCNYFLFAVAAYVGLVLRDEGDILPLIITMLDVVIFLGSSFIFVALQKKCVDLTKKLNPEKNGNIFDKNFSKEWLASCDEAQQLIIYKASFKAYQNVGAACQILWILSLVGMLSFDAGLLPTFCVSAIILVMQVSYYRECKKLERGKK